LSLTRVWRRTHLRRAPPGQSRRSVLNGCRSPGARNQFCGPPCAGGRQVRFRPRLAGRHRHGRRPWIPHDSRRAISADRLPAVSPDQSAGVIATDETLPTPKSTRTGRSVPKSTYIGIPACQDSQEIWGCYAEVRTARPRVTQTPTASTRRIAECC
jgi:hypothetical protein